MILSGLLFLPLASLVPIYFIKKQNLAKILAFAFSIFQLIYTFLVFFKIQGDYSVHQLIEKIILFKPLGFHYALGVDGLSLSLILLSSLIMPFTLLSIWKSLDKVYIYCLFAIQSCLLGAFLSLDLLLFYFFFEASLIPMFLLMGIKGGKRSVYAAKKLFFFTFSGSVLLLGSILTMVVLHESVFGEPSALMSDLVKIQLPFIKNTIFSTQTVLFLGFMTAFAVKLPVFPLHTWLPDAHVEAPTGGSIFLASLMLKLGGYGFLRFISLYFPQASAQYAPIVCTLALIGIVYGAVLSFAQSDIKKLVAYSSISHMGYVILGVFTWNHLGLKGASFQMISHGLSTGALFMMIGMLYERVKTKEMKEMGGLSKFMPNFTVCFLILAFANMAVPATSGFVGEFFVLAGAFKSNLFYGLTASLGVFLGAAYTLKMIKQVFYGSVRGNYVPENLYDLKPREWCALVPIIVLILVLGIYPSLVTDFFAFKSEIVFKFYDGGLYGLI